MLTSSGIREYLTFEIGRIWGSPLRIMILKAQLHLSWFSVFTHFFIICIELQISLNWKFSTSIGYQESINLFTHHQWIVEIQTRFWIPWTLKSWCTRRILLGPWLTCWILWIGSDYALSRNRLKLETITKINNFKILRCCSGPWDAGSKSWFTESR